MTVPTTATEERRIIGRTITTILNQRGPLSIAQRAALDNLNVKLDDVEHRVKNEHEEQYSRAFKQFLIGGEMMLSASERALLRDREARDMVSGTGAYPGGNGPFVPVQFVQQVDAMLKATDDLFSPDVITRIETPRGGPASIPNFDDTSSAATVVTQGNLGEEQDLANLGQLSFATCPTWRSGYVLASVELDQDSAFSLDTLIAASFGVRFARGIGAANVTTLLTSATLGATANGSSANTGGSGTGANSIGSDDLYSLAGSIDSAYLASPKTAWVMNYNTLIALGKLTDKNGRPLKLVVRNDDTGDLELLFKPVRICPSMPDIGTGATPIAFGDLSRFVVRLVTNGMRLQRYGERWAEFGKVGYQGFLRADSGVQVTQNASPPTDSPIKYLANA